MTGSLSSALLELAGTPVLGIQSCQHCSEVKLPCYMTEGKKKLREK